MQDIMMTSVEKALPRMDIDLPPGLKLGLSMGTADEVSPLEPPQAELTAKDIALADRELAAAWVVMFHRLKNPKNLCVLFRNEKLAMKAKRAWRDTGGIRVAGFPESKGLQNPVEALGKAVGKRIFVVAVAPRDKQLQQLKELEDRQTEELRLLDPTGEKATVGMIVILLNARLRGQTEQSEMARYWADSSNPVYHARWVGPKGEGLLFHSLFQEWCLLSRGESPRELLRLDSEPSNEQIERALVQGSVA